MEHAGDAEKLAVTIITLGGLLLIGFAADGLGRRTKLPRVTLMLLCGFLIGPSVFDLLPDLGSRWFPAVADMALVMIGFLLGETLTAKSLRERGKLTLFISIGEVGMAAFLVGAGLFLIGAPMEAALLLAGIAPASDPAATVDVVREYGAKGKFSKTLLGVVAIDDAWGLIVFSLMLAATRALGGEGSGLQALADGSWDLVGAVMVGLGLGIPMAYATGRVRPGEPTLSEALGLVFLCGGVALWLNVSFIIAAMVMGVAVANLARHHDRPFHAIEDIEWPFMILFFVLAGASLRLESLPGIGLIGGAYVALRAAGLALGAWIGGVMSGAEKKMRRWIGLALMPQAGVAIGMALIASRQSEQMEQIILPVAIASTAFFEFTGPVLTKIALNRAGEGERKFVKKPERP